MKASGCALVQEDWSLYEKRDAQRGCHVTTEVETGVMQPPAKEHGGRDGHHRKLEDAGKDSPLQVSKGARP